MEIKDSHFPNLFIAADQASIKAQNTYLRLTRLELCLLILAAGISIYAFEAEKLKLVAHCTSGLFMLVTIVITLVIKQKKYEKYWYEGRALAESVKTVSWRYMTKSESFNEGDPAINKQKIIQRLKELEHEFKDLMEVLSASLLQLPTVTDMMEEVRNSDLQKRIEVYKASRIENQITWYSGKADLNKNLSDYYFFALLAIQSFAVIASVYLIAVPNSEYNFVGILTTIAAALMTWIQVKRYRELNTAYSTTASELVRIRDSMFELNGEQKFAGFVLDSENAISREHTTWLAQRR